MSVAHPFAGFNPKPTIWGYNWTAPEPPPPKVSPPPPPPPAQSPPMMVEQYANIPAALINTLKREKKPFTYTPGGVNLSEVLNQRLQKRMERKKKYCEERASTPKQLIVAPTYNTPLDMYSTENALEAMVAQAELVAADKSLSSPSRSATLPRNHTFRFENDADKGVAQSKAFRVLQIITDTEETSTDRNSPQHIDEMRFTGLRENKADIPSRFFHNLQRITGTEEQEEADAQVQPLRRQPEPRPQPSSSAPPNVPPARGPSSAPTPGLKRPAAFLPIKTSPGFRPVSFLSNGPVQRNSSGGTDF